MIVVEARSRWADRASWTWRTVWGLAEDHRWSITARSSSPRRVILAMFGSSPRGGKSRVLRRYYGASYPTRLNNLCGGAECSDKCSDDGHRRVIAPTRGLVSPDTRGSFPHPADYSKATLTQCREVP